MFTKKFKLFSKIEIKKIQYKIKYKLKRFKIGK